MITRRGFFGTVVALVVGGGAARLRLTAPAVVGGINPSMFPWWRVQVPASTASFGMDELRAVWEGCVIDECAPFGEAEFKLAEDVMKARER